MTLQTREGIIIEINKKEDCSPYERWAKSDHKRKNSIFDRWEHVGCGILTADGRHCFYLDGENAYEIPPSIDHLWIGTPPKNWEPLKEDDPEYKPLLTWEILRGTNSTNDA